MASTVSVAYSMTLRCLIVIITVSNSRNFMSDRPALKICDIVWRPCATKIYVHAPQPNLVSHSPTEHPKLPMFTPLAIMFTAVFPAVIGTTAVRCESNMHCIVVVKRSSRLVGAHESSVALNKFRFRHAFAWQQALHARYKVRRQVHP